jgi:hypothetical protein
MSTYSPDDDRGDPRQLAARIRGDDDHRELAEIDPDTTDPRELARLIYAAHGTGRTR